MVDLSSLNLYRNELSGMASASAASETDEQLLVATRTPSGRIRYYAQPRHQRALPESISYRVKHSWEVLADHPQRMEKVGVRFFVRMFVEHPELLPIFPFGNFLSNIIDNKRNGTATAAADHDDDMSLVDEIEGVQLPPALKVHAFMVIETIGKFVTGLTKLEDLVPMLRALGHVHDAAGVQPHHYNIMLHYLFEAIGEELNDYDQSYSCLSDDDDDNNPKDNQSHWDDETKEAWELAFRTITSIITNPNERLQIEPLEGWGALNAFSCAYVAFLCTPIQLAGFAALHAYAERALDAFKLVSIGCFSIDMLSHWVAQKAKSLLHPKSTIQKKNAQQRRTLIDACRVRIYQCLFPIFYKLVRFMRSLRMERWEHWPRMDAVILLSFLVEYLSHKLFRLGNVPSGGSENGTGSCSVVFDEKSVGVHWTCGFGVVRMIAGVRVWHYWTCAENNTMLRRRISSAERTQMRIAKLFLAMLLVVHMSACLYCVVARIELVPAATTMTDGACEAVQATGTGFFPHPEYLLGRAGVLKSYVHACYWAFVNLAGIGSVDSTPETTLECVFMLVVHLVGATFYAIMTGNVVAILEDATDKENETGSDLTALGDFMHACCIPPSDQKRILHGYLMQEMSGQKNDDTTNSAAVRTATNIRNNSKTDNELFVVPDVVEKKLPSFLKQEINLFARAQAIQARERVFSSVCQDFIFAMVGGLSETQILLPGDYLCKEDCDLPHKVFFVEDGVIDVIHEGKCLRTLRRGNVVGKRWLLLDELGKTRGRRSSSTAATFRALTSCTLMSGLDDRDAIGELRRRYPKDFRLLLHQRDQYNQALSLMQKRRGSKDGIQINPVTNGHRSSKTSSITGCW